MEKVQITTPGIKKALKRYNYCQAISEYIWNGYDASATIVHLEFDSNEVGTILEIRVRDNGYGISKEKLGLKFIPFFESDKEIDPHIRKGNSAYHGKNGVGRLTFFHFSTDATWETIYTKKNNNYKYSININADRLENYNDSDPIITESPAGTTVKFHNIYKITMSDVEFELQEHLAKEFGWFLELNKQKGFQLIIDNKIFDYKSMINDDENFTINYEKNDTNFAIRYVQWREKINNEYSRYYFINSTNQEIFKKTTTLNNKGDAYYHSVFITSEFFDQFDPIIELPSEQNLFHEPTKSEEYRYLLNEVDSFLRTKRKPFLKQYTDRLIDDFEKNDAFPKYNTNNVWELSRKSELENVVRELYQVEPKIFSNLNIEQKKTFVRLLDIILDSGETESLFNILNEIVELDSDERDELANLLLTSRLNRIIKTIKLIRDRYVAVDELKKLVFDESLKANEVDHLQKYIEKHYWIFGEQYHLVTAAEPKFEEALRRYLYLLRGEKKNVKINHPDKYKEMDIFAVRQDFGNDSIDNIVVELKHPTKLLGEKEINQVKKYMGVILETPEFNAPNMFWEFFLVGKNFNTSKYIEGELENAKHHGEKSLVYKTNRYKIYVKKWSELFTDFEIRHKFLNDKLDLERRKLETNNKSAVEIIRKSAENSASTDGEPVA